MLLPRLNGKIDYDEVANILVSYMLAKTYKSLFIDTRISLADERELENYIKMVLKAIEEQK